MHYLLQQNKLSETGTYMGLVEARNVAVPEAVQQAYGSSVAQFEQSLKDYFRSVTPLLQIAERPQVPASGAAHGPIHQSSAPLTPLDVGTSILRLQEFEAQARVDELAVRIPERREQAVKDLQSLITLPKEETAIAHRALAWVHMQKRDYDDAFEELASAAELDPADPWVHYYLALAKYQQATETGNPIQGLANMMQDLRRVTDWNRDFAEAYNMLAMAQLQGGGLHAAADSMRPAIQLNPRSETYLLNLARIYLEGKKWDDATALLDRLKSSHDSQIARAAQQHLHDLPMLKKYGIPPQENPQAAAAPTPVLSNNTEDAYAGAEPPESAPAEAGPDLRKTQFLRGTLLGVDCSQPPAAIVKLSGGGKTLQLRTEDCRSLLVIGAGAFSCDWKNVAVQVNYKAGGKANGDLVSLEIR
jgi:tetratricopeptide (TPR) repeat protein